MGIEEWLADLDLGRYADHFVREEVTLDDLALLTEDDLASMGLPLGPRRRILRAVVGGTEGLSGEGSGTAVAGVVLWLLLVAGLWLIWLGLFRRRRLALAPFLLVQAFALVLVPLFWGSDVTVWRVVGAVLAVLAVGGVVLGLRPSVRAALH